ncbi:MAG: class I tRNA ligase family protein, partial [Steroidobacteraceae bacterium]
WYDFCDWYLELAKPVLQSPQTPAALRAGTRATLAEILEALQRALHPFMPFITEEIWQRAAPLAGRAGDTVMLEPWPQAAQFPADAHAEREVAWIQAVVLGVRQIRGEMNINPARRIPLLLRDAGDADRELSVRHRAWLERLAGLESVTLLRAGDDEPPAAIALAGSLTLLVPMAGLIDAPAEAERLGKLIAKAEKELAGARARLASDSFVNNAPAPVVATERERLTELERSVAGLRAQLERVRKLL